MATSVTSSFAGKYATDYFITALSEGKTVSTAGVTIDTDVQFKYIAPTLSTSGFVQSGTTCGWNEGGTTTVGELSVELAPFYINKSECINSYLKLWDFTDPTKLPAKVQEKLEMKSASDIRKDAEKLYWQGSITTGSTTGGTYTKSQFNGFIKQLNGVAAEIAGNTLSATNIVAKLNAAFQAASTELKAIATDSPEKVVFFVSYAAENFLKDALAAQGNNTTDNAYVAKHKNIEVRGVNLFTNVIVFGLREDFHFPSNIGMDDARIDFISMVPQGEDNVRIKASYRYACLAVNPSQMVLVGF